MKQEIKLGTTDYTAFILIRDTAGAAKTGLAFGSAGMDVSYARVETDNDVVVAGALSLADLATPALTDPHLDWGFLEVDATKHPGLYRLDIADEVFAAGAWSGVVTVIGTGLDPVHIEYILVDYTSADLQTLLLDIPTTAEIALRTLLAAEYTIVADLGVVQTGDSFARIGAAGISLTAITDAITALENISTANVNTEVDNALNTAIPAVPTADSINDYIRRLKEVLVNLMAITEASGNVVGYKDDDVTPAYTVAAAFTTAAGITTRKKLE